MLAPLLLAFLLCFPPPPPAPSPIARLPRLRTASLLGGALVAGQRRRQSSARARAAAARAYAPCFPCFTRYIGIPLAAPGTLPAPGLAARGPFVSVRAADETGQTYLFGGPSPGNPSVPLNATCTSNPRRTAPSTGKHPLLFCLAVRTAYCTAEPTFVGAAAVGNCAAPPDSIGEHEDRRASETAMDSTSARPPPRAHMVACLAMEWLEWLECSCSQKHCGKLRSDHFDRK